MDPHEPRQVALFAGCTVNFLDPGIGMDCLAVLRHNGIRVLHPEQHCCGVPLLAYGNDRGFSRKATGNLRSLDSADCDAVTPCTSCAYALKAEYPALMADPKAQKIAARTYDVMEYLTRMQEQALLNTAFQRLDLNILYHAPCHLKCLGQELIDARLRLLRLIPGIRLEQIDRGCCGMGGTFGMKKNHYAVSLAIGRGIAEKIRDVKPDLIVTECPGCRLQIGHMAGITVRHPIHLIKMAYGL